MATENRKNNTEWLIEKLRTAEVERDEAISHAKNMEIDNLRLRMKLQAISSIVSGEVYIEDMFLSPMMSMQTPIFPILRKTAVCPRFERKELHNV